MIYVQIIGCDLGCDELKDIFVIIMSKKGHYVDLCERCSAMFASTLQTVHV